MILSAEMIISLFPVLLQQLLYEKIRVKLCIYTCITYKHVNITDHDTLNNTSHAVISSILIAHKGLIS